MCMAASDRAQLTLRFDKNEVDKDEVFTHVVCLQDIIQQTLHFNIDNTHTLQHSPLLYNLIPI